MLVLITIYWKTETLHRKGEEIFKLVQDQLVCNGADWDHLPSLGRPGQRQQGVDVFLQGWQTEDLEGHPVIRSIVTHGTVLSPP